MSVRGGQQMFQRDGSGSGLEGAVEIIRKAKERFAPVRTVILFSGGDDSLVLLDVAGPYADAVAHINTGIGIPDTTVFARERMADSGLTALEFQPPESYEALVFGPWHGFPGPGFHGPTYQRLKERCVRQLVRESKVYRSRDKVMLLTGVRRAESRRRMGYTDPVDVRGAQIWVNPLLDWTNEDMAAWRAERGLPQNPVSVHLHMSGECLCGAMADDTPKREEFEMIRFFYPAFAARITSLEAEARCRGLRYCEWGRKGRTSPAVPGPLCVGCEQRSLFEASP